ncbi:MAG TPA: sulfite dehydrogenase [Micropepsaceae bacterium]
MADTHRTAHPQVPHAAANGLLDRRALLGQGVVFAGAAAASVTGIASAAAEPLKVDPWSTTIGAPVTTYSLPSHFESKVIRTIGDNSRPGTQQARTPHQDLDGIITPAALHFVVARAGAPDIDPGKHRLLIHGMVKQPLIFSLNDLMRYPMESHIRFIECGGNSAPMWSKTPIQASVQALHGLLSCSEWTGIRLSTLLDEAGVDPKASWIIAEGADGVTMNRSIPVAKAMDDAMIVFYQNGERIHPWNGYPMRLLVPGYEGNMNVKWLRRLKLTGAPVMAINESRQYTLLLESGKAWRFYYPEEVKSFITRPSPTMTMPAPGYYEISGLAWSGHGRIEKVEVSADGGKSWALAALQAPVLPKALTRFRMPWNWSGQPVVLQSRATDEGGNVQPTRERLMAERGEPRNTPNVAAFPMNHVNCISSWGIDAKGAVSHVYV